MNEPEVSKKDCASNLRSVSYLIPGKPIPLARARYGNTHNKMWDSQKAIKNAASIVLLNGHNTRPFFEGPLHIDIDFYFPRAAKNPPPENSFMHYKPDIDNLIKFVLDISNGILFHDDSCISSITATKRYSADPRTHIHIIEIR